MPKCATDPVLLEQMIDFIREHQLTVSAAATHLGVDRTTLWRFCTSGKAREDTKALYRESLIKCNTITATNTAHHKELIEGRKHLALQETLTERQLNQIRKACEGVLALLVAYETQQIRRGKIKGAVMRNTAEQVD